MIKGSHNAMNRRPLVLYHANCADGFCAAWVAHRKLGDGADYLPVQYGQEPPDAAGRDVLILDFSYKRLILEEMSRKAASVIVLDHHKTAQAELAAIGCDPISGYLAGGKTLLCVFNMDKSGSRLAWEHFFFGKPSPWLVDYTEDRDLWRWKLPNSREVSAALASLPRDFATWDDLDARGVVGNRPPESLAGEGRAILRYQSQLVDSIAAAARECDVGGHKVLAANTSCLFSEVAEKLAAGRPFGAAWFVRSDGKKQWSLRSRDGGIDVSEVAKRHGGGGHRNAAGFEE